MAKRDKLAHQAVCAAFELASNRGKTAATPHDVGIAEKDTMQLGIVATFKGMSIGKLVKTTHLGRMSDSIRNSLTRKLNSCETLVISVTDKPFLPWRALYLIVTL
ncbi:hypothetical protein T11_15530 [Trichinella zimbabwensis]|uniref:Uncharacterized protein n=1 Tax=Trichinella zimbabwensis TaxID=268475 RepID=A0A0V1HT87_9BILA|nr:hypothetical protein T11_15530 [Trichinella zimbabwensis]